MQVEELAKIYHEVCREMVNKQIGMITKPTQPYIEWDNLTDDQRKGRLFIAEELLKRLLITDKIDEVMFKIDDETVERIKALDKVFSNTDGLLKQIKENINLKNKCNQLWHDVDKKSQLYQNTYKEMQIFAKMGLEKDILIAQLQTEISQLRMKVH